MIYFHQQLFFSKQVRNFVIFVHNFYQYFSVFGIAIRKYRYKSLSSLYDCNVLLYFLYFSNNYFASETKLAPILRGIIQYYTICLNCVFITVLWFHMNAEFRKKVCPIDILQEKKFIFPTKSSLHVIKCVYRITFSLLDNFFH